MSYWLEERTELALGTKRYSHAPFVSTDDRYSWRMEEPGSCPVPELAVDNKGFDSISVLYHSCLQWKWSGVS